MAITQDGIHVLVYLGDGNWIQADPMTKKVFTGNPATLTNYWYAEPVNIVRWTIWK